MVYRPELQMMDAPTDDEGLNDWRAEMDKVKGTAKIYMRKNRSLPLSKIDVRFNGVKFFSE
jgi:hypothetical protein